MTAEETPLTPAEEALVRIETKLDLILARLDRSTR